MTDDGRVFPVKAVLASSRLNDLALLKVDAEDLRPLPRGRRRAGGSEGLLPLPSGAIQRKGQLFFDLQPGNGLLASSLSTTRSDELLNVLAITAEYGPGASGGPILNDARGRSGDGLPGHAAAAAGTWKRHADGLETQPAVVQYVGPAEPAGGNPRSRAIAKARSPRADPLRRWRRLPTTQGSAVRLGSPGVQ